jgi:hypothetical protein
MTLKRRGSKKAGKASNKGEGKDRKGDSKPGLQV